MTTARAKIAAAAIVPLLLGLGLPRVARAQDLAPPPPMNPNGVPSNGAPTYGQPAQPGYGQPTYVQPGAPTTTTTTTTTTQPAPATETTAELDESKKEDSGRVLEFFYAKAGASFSYVGLDALNTDKLQLVKTSGVGPAFDVGAGLRLLVFTIGPRLRWNVLTNFDLWQLDGEFGIHIPVGKWDGYFGLFGGYSWIGSFGTDAITNATATGNAVPPDVRVRGFDVGLEFGADYYVVPYFSIGAEVAGQLLFLKRPAVDGAAPDSTFGQEGGAAGVGALGGLHIGLHL